MRSAEQPRSGRWWTWAVALLLTWSHPRAARAWRSMGNETVAPVEGIAVARLEVVGDMPDPMKARMHDALVAGLRRSGVQWREVDLSESGSCNIDDAICLAAMAADAGADRLLVSQVTADGRLFDSSLVLVDAQTREVILRSDQPCKPCGSEEVVDLVRQQAASLGDRFERLEAMPAVLVVQSAVPAELFVDGKHVGATPAHLQLAPGPHQVRASAPGFRDATLTLTAVRGVQEKWVAALDPLPPEKPQDVDRARGRGLRIGGYTALGLSVASLAPGVAFLVLHQRPYEADCAMRDAEGRCPNRWRSLPHGIALTVTAGGLLAAAIPLLVVGHRRAAEPRIGFGPGPGIGASLGGRF